jgi:hypothetical protein
MRSSDDAVDAVDDDTVNVDVTVPLRGTVAVVAASDVEANPITETMATRALTERNLDIQTFFLRVFGESVRNALHRLCSCDASSTSRAMCDSISFGASLA